MNENIAAIILLCLICSCGPNGNHGNMEPRPAVFPTEFVYEKLEGVYAGDFNGNIIHINLRKVTGRNAVGYTIQKGLRRNISGNMEFTDYGFHFVLKEPGNNPGDGVFDVLVDTTEYTMKGSWMPRTNGKLPTISFLLAKSVNENEYGMTYSDSLHTISFGINGQCTYAFYKQDTNGMEARQMTRVKGNWTLKDNCFTIEWEQNNALSAGRDKICIDSLLRDSTSNYYSKFLKFNGRILSNGDY